MTEEAQQMPIPTRSELSSSQPPCANLALVQWLKRQLDELVRAWDHAREHLRGQKLRQARRTLTRWAAALMMAGGLAWHAVAPAYAWLPIFEDPGIVAEVHPLYGVDVGSDSIPAFVDIDNDGDFDVFIGSDDGTLTYYRNDGSASTSRFTEVTGTAHPLDGVRVDSFSAPAFVDVDGDGDFDAFVGGYYGSVRYYENTGDASNPAFTQRKGVDNPLDSVALGYYNFVAPAFVDVDGDGDFDAFITDDYGRIIYYENTGGDTSPTFTQRTETDNPLNVDVGNESAPAFVDVDADGDFDAFLGANDGALYYYENTGSATNPSFTARTGTDNPFDGADVGYDSAPAFVDLDADGDFDAYIGTNDGTLDYYRNDGTAGSPSFIAVTSDTNPFMGVEVFSVSDATFVDVDDDGDFDLFIGEYYGAIDYYENIGTPSTPDLVESTGTANPMDGVDVGGYSKPASADIDNDGDPDLLIGSGAGTVDYFKNTGTAGNPSFAAVTGSANPFDGVDVGYYSVPTLVDIDKDDDIDVFIGGNDGTLYYYENTGSANSPIFAQRTGTDNPFDGVDVGYNSAPAFADIDNDGDFDALTGNGNGSLNYYENSGTATNPSFVGRTGGDSPFEGLKVPSTSIPTFVDIDGDGDPDAVIGNGVGNLIFYQHYGVHRETQAVTGSEDVSFGWKGNRVILNANGTDLGDTEVFLASETQPTNVEDEAVRHRFYITPTTTSGLNASLTFFFDGSELPTGLDCNALDVYHWNGNGWDQAITPNSRQCAFTPYSLTVSGVNTFSPFVLREPDAPNAVGLRGLVARTTGTLGVALLSLIAVLGTWLGLGKHRPQRTVDSDSTPARFT
jgi:hypothetical protein